MSTGFMFQPPGDQEKINALGFGIDADGTYYCIANVNNNASPGVALVAYKSTDQGLNWTTSGSAGTTISGISPVPKIYFGNNHAVVACHGGDSYGYHIICVWKFNMGSSGSEGWDSFYQSSYISVDDFIPVIRDNGDIVIGYHVYYVDETENSYVRPRYLKVVSGTLTSGLTIETIPDSSYNYVLFKMDLDRSTDKIFFSIFYSTSGGNYCHWHIMTNFTMGNANSYTRNDAPEGGGQIDSVAFLDGSIHKIAYYWYPGNSDQYKHLCILGEDDSHSDISLGTFAQSEFQIGLLFDKVSQRFVFLTGSSDYLTWRYWYMGIGGTAWIGPVSTDNEFYYPYEQYDTNHIWLPSGLNWTSGSAGSISYFVHEFHHCDNGVIDWYDHFYQLHSFDLHLLRPVLLSFKSSGSNPSVSGNNFVALPYADRTNENWTTHTSGSSGLWQSIDDYDIDNVDYIQSPALPDHFIYETDLTKLTTPVTLNDIWVHYSLWRSAISISQANCSYNVTVRLIQKDYSVLYNWAQSSYGASASACCTRDETVWGLGDASQPPSVLIDGSDSTWHECDQNGGCNGNCSTDQHTCWKQVDLGQVRSVNRFRAYFSYWSGWAWSWKLQYSNDGSIWTDVFVSTLASAPTVDWEEIHTFDAIEARYWRMQMIEGENDPDHGWRVYTMDLSGYEDEIEIACWTHNGVGSTPTSYNQNLSTEQAGLITNWGLLHLVFDAWIEEI